MTAKETKTDAIHKGAPKDQEYKTMRCFACGNRVDANKIHRLVVRQKNTPIKNQIRVFATTSEVSVCPECFALYGRK
jgi:hypothetical protein